MKKNSSAFRKTPLNKLFKTHFRGGGKIVSRRQSVKKQRVSKRSRSSRNNSSSRNNRKRTLKNKRGGGVGYTFNLEGQRIGGRPEVLGYNNHPEYRNGQLVESTLNDKLCSGGGKKRKGSKGRKGSRGSRGRKGSKGRNHHNKSGRNSHGNKMTQVEKRDYLRRQAQRKNSNSRQLHGGKLNLMRSDRLNSTNSREMRGKMRGGDGDLTNFSDDMNTREFGCKQPNWEPKCT